MTDQQAKAIITSRASYASMRAIEPDGIAVAVIAQKTNLVPLIATISVIGLLGMATGLWLMVKPPAFFAAGTLSDAAVKLLIPSCLIIVLGPMLLIARLVNGPARNAEFQAAPGQLTADRYIAGDHVRSTYTADEVRCLFLEGKILSIETRKGNSQFITYGTAQVNQAIAYLLARHLWPRDQVRVKRSAKSMLSHVPERTFVYRDQSGNANHK